MKDVLNGDTAAEISRMPVAEPTARVVANDVKFIRQRLDLDRTEELLSAEWVQKRDSQEVQKSKDINL